MGLILVGLCVALVIWLYFAYNPMKHSKKFMTRRFWNWFPLGMSYAFLYMARYNLNVLSGALNNVVTNKDFGRIVGYATTVYAVSLVLNGPLVDKFGGKKGILVSTIGAALANIGMGVITYLYLKFHVNVNIVL